MNERAPKILSPEEIAETKTALREYLLSKYIPAEGVRRPIKLEGSGYDRQVREGWLAALESEDPDKLERLAYHLDVWYAYILEKDRPESLKAEALREKLLAWIDSILAR